MNPAMIVQLVVALGPIGLQLAQDLAALWNQPTLTVEQVNAICGKAQKGYDAYIAEARAKLT